MKAWIGVDLDGTLAHYEHWVSPLHIGLPIPAMVERVKGWLSEGKDIRIFTARVCMATPEDIQAGTCQITNTIRAWCLEHIGQELPVTNIKDFGMVELWDDRAVQVAINTGKPYGPHGIVTEPYNIPAGFRECHYCHGTGTAIVKGPTGDSCCAACGGSGTLADLRSKP